MSNELRTHLASLHGWLALLPDSARQQALVDLAVVEQSLERKDALLRQALEFIEAMDEESCLLLDAITKEIEQ